MKEKKLLIIGASGHGKVVGDIALNMKCWSNIAYLDDNKELQETMNLKVIGTVGDLIRFIKEYEIIIALGSNPVREKLLVELKQMQAKIPTLIHPGAMIGAMTKIGEGTVVMAGAVINCCSTIGKGCIINTGATIDHDCMIDDYVHISPGVHIAGTVSIGKNSWIGIGSTIKNNIFIASDCIVGAGSVVVKDLVEPATYMGVPARQVEV